MKVKSVNLSSTYPAGRTLKSSGFKERVHEKERHELTTTANKYDNINTSIKRNPDARVSFKGGVPIKTPLIHRMANFASYSPLVAEALFALVITCGLRPAFIMATAKTDEEKDKCAYQAAKSISSGLVGLGMTALVGTPIAAAANAAKNKKAFVIPEEVKKTASEKVKEGVKVLAERAEEIKDIATINIKELISGDKINTGLFAKAGKHGEKNFIEGTKQVLESDAAKKVVEAVQNQKLLNNYERTAKNVIDKFFQPVFMPLRATVTIALVPVILGVLGLKKSSGKKKAEGQDKQNPFNNVDLNFGKRIKSDVFSEFSRKV